MPEHAGALVVCGVLLLASVALNLWAYRDKLKALIARLKGTSGP